MSGISLSSNNLILVYILWFIWEACGEWVYKIFLFLTIWHIFIVYLWLHSVLNLSLLLLLFYLISLLTLLSRLYEFLSHILIIFFCDKLSLIKAFHVSTFLKLSIRTWWQWLIALCNELNWETGVLLHWNLNILNNH